MKTMIRRIILGAKELPGYGPHPGTGIFVAMIIVGGMVGLSREDASLYTFLVGVIFMFICLFPLWCMGAIERAKDYERDMQRTYEILSREH